MSAPSPRPHRIRTGRVLATVMAALLVPGFATRLAAATRRESFTENPSLHGWIAEGDSSLFAWDADRGRLGVTWDSSRSNAFFLLPLSTTLARTDDARFACTLVLDELRTASPANTFQLALGFVRRRDAVATNFFRGAGIHPAWGPRNLLEFDYFPASRSITPTFSAVAVGTNNLRWAMANLFPFELTPGDPYRIELHFTAGDQTLRLRVERNGQPWCSGSTRLDERFGDFRLDAFSVTSYSADHQPAGYGGGLFARGWIDDLELAHSDPPAPRLQCQPATADRGPVFFAAAVPGWRPRWSRWNGGGSWEPVETTPSGTNVWILVDPAPPPGFAAYRLCLDRP